MLDTEAAETRKRLRERGEIIHGFNCGDNEHLCIGCLKLVAAFWKIWDEDNGYAH